jgi:hypothetical protein
MIWVAKIIGTSAGNILIYYLAKIVEINFLIPDPIIKSSEKGSRQKRRPIWFEI